ncbi:MAG: GH3 auxin-responsive promoter family protein [Chitinophagales bacterium]
MSLINAFMKQYLAARMGRIKSFVSNPHQWQQQIFNHLVQQGSKTAFGKEHSYSAIKQYSDFKNNVPLNDYENLKPWIERIQKGEQNVLWPAPIKWFAKSSGTTTDKSKYIPLTTEAIRFNHVLGGKDLMAIYYNRFPKSRVFAGKSLIVGGSLSENFAGAKAGDLSAVLIHRMPEWLQFFRVPSREVITMSDWEKKIDAIVKSCINENLMSISGVPTWIIMILKRALEVSGKKTVAEVWPELELFVHGGVSFTPYAEEYNRLIGKPINYLEAYNASEGFFAFHDFEGEGMLLHAGSGIFYEFIPLEELDKPQPQAISLESVEVGKNYAIVISTTTGLWRYMPGDTISFTGTKPYRIIITGRTKSFINVFGEEVMVHNTDKALAQTCAQFNCVAHDYTVAPRFLTSAEKGAHEWLIEFEKEPLDLNLFASRLDENLQRLNSDYEAKREGGLALQQLIVHTVKPQTFYRWLASKNKLGGQHKVPRLNNNRKIFEEIQAFM